MITDPVYRSNFTEDFLIARDAESRQFYAVSESFRDLCVRNDLLIDYLDRRQ